MTFYDSSPLYRWDFLFFFLPSYRIIYFADKPAFFSRCTKIFSFSFSIMTFYPFHHNKRAQKLYFLTHMMSLSYNFLFLFPSQPLMSTIRICLPPHRIVIAKHNNWHVQEIGSVLRVVSASGVEYELHKADNRGTWRIHSNQSHWPIECYNFVEKNDGNWRTASSLRHLLRFELWQKTASSPHRRHANRCSSDSASECVLTPMSIFNFELQFASISLSFTTTQLSSNPFNFVIQSKLQFVTINYEFTESNSLSSWNQKFTFDHFSVRKLGEPKIWNNCA